MFNISRMLSIHFGEKLLLAFLSTSPAAKVLWSRIPVELAATQCSPSATTAWRPLTARKSYTDKTVFSNCEFEMLLTFYLYFSPTPPLWQIHTFEIMSVFNYQNQYKNSSMLLNVKSRSITHFQFKCRFLPSFHIIKIFFKVNIKARGIRTDTA